MKNRGLDIKTMWDKIPQDIHILITHGPPLGVLDKVAGVYPENNGFHVGCEDLLNKTKELNHLKLHVFGHIHESYGISAAIRNIKFVNASIMNEDLEPVNKPIRVILKAFKIKFIGEFIPIFLAF